MNFINYIFNIHFSELQFSHDVMDNAVAVLHKIEHFISNCHNYIVGNWNTGDVNEATLFRVSYLSRCILLFYIKTYIYSLLN